MQQAGRSGLETGRFGGGGGRGRGSWGVWGEVNRGRLITITMATTSTIRHNYLDRLMLLLLSILILVNLFTEMLLLVAGCPELTHAKTQQQVRAVSKECSSHPRAPAAGMTG